MNSVMWSTAVICSVRSLMCTEKYEIYKIKDQRNWTYSMHGRMYVLVKRNEGKKILGRPRRRCEDKTGTLFYRTTRINNSFRPLCTTADSAALAAISIRRDSGSTHCSGAVYYP